MERLVRSSKQVGEALTHFRHEKGTTQSQVADKTSLRQATISAIESGGGGVKLQTFFDVLVALDLEVVIRPRTKGSVSEIEDIFS